MSVGRICCREVDLAAPDESVFSAAQRMRAARVGTLVVLNEARKPIGIVTDRDLVTRVIVAGRDPQRTPVGEIMTHDPRVISDDTPIESALALMRTTGCRRLPVIDDRRQLVGILSLDDVLELLAEEFANVGMIVARRGPPGHEPARPV